MLRTFTVRQTREFLIVALFAIQCGFLRAESIYQLAQTPHGSLANSGSTSLPLTMEKIDEAVVAIEASLAEVRRRASSPKIEDSRAVIALAATPEELANKEQLIQQWIVALGQHARHLRMLKEIRRVNQERAGEEDSWSGFPETPTIVQSEQLTDLVSARRLELRTAQMFLAIVEGEISRFAERLSESHKQLRLANDEPERGRVQDLRCRWLAQISQLRVQAEEASVEAAAIGRLVTWEAMTGLQKYIQFLERKVSAARSQARLTKADLEGVLTQINAKRAALQKELNEAIGIDKELRVSFQTQPTNILGMLPAGLASEIQSVRLEASGQKVELMRGFLQLADFAQSIWEDRFWTAEQRGLKEVRTKQRHYADLLRNLGQWKQLIEQSLAAVSDQVLRQAIRMEDSRLSLAEREAAKVIHAALQERARTELRAVGALTFTEDLTARLHAELSEQVERVSISVKVNSIVREVGSLLERLWRIELYIAEDSVIASGRKISIPRSITLGKVIIALSIFLLGLLAARYAYRITGRFVSESSAKIAAAAVAVISLVIAMASVRIPWTVFAFMGGALAIGVGFGAQTLVNNFISGVILLGERTIRVGDIVEVDDQRGKVMHMGFRHSLIARGDGSEVLVPNSQFLEKKLVNWTLHDDLVRHSVSVGVAYGQPPDEVSRLIAQAVSENPDVAKGPAAQVLFDDFGEKALIFTLKFWVKLCPTIDGGQVRSDLRHRINTLLEDAGILMCPLVTDASMRSGKRNGVRSGGFHASVPIEFASRTA